MKFLFIIGEVFTLDLARRLQDEGHTVRCFIKDREDRDVADGILQKVNDWRPYARKKDWILVFEDTRQGRTQDRLRREGRLVVGGTERGERLELDRAFGQEMCRKANLPIVPYRDFRDFDSAIAFVRENPKRWVMKKAGRVERRAADYKGAFRDGSDVLARLQFLKEHWNPKVRPHFQLQEWIDGIEVGIGTWFNGHDWVLPYTLTFEHQPLMAGDIGSNTGEMYSTAWHLSDRKHRLFREALEPMTEFFRSIGHVGYVDLNGIVNETGFHPLEWTVRFGMPLAMLQYRLMAGRQPFGEFLAGLAQGNLASHPYHRRYCIGGVVAASPFPYEGISPGLVWSRQRRLEKRIAAGMDIFKIIGDVQYSTYQELSRGMPVFLEDRDRVLEYLHLVEVKKEDGFLVTAGTSGYCFVATDLGRTPEEAGEKVLGHIRKIHGLPWIYRNDLGVGESAKLRELEGYGYEVALPEAKNGNRRGDPRA